MELLIRLGAQFDQACGRVVFSHSRFRAEFVASATEADRWEVCVSPHNDRPGSRTFVVTTVADVFAALYFTGHAVGTADLRAKFLNLFEIAGLDDLAASHSEQK
jgi:hypothetical protein